MRLRASLAELFGYGLATCVAFALDVSMLTLLVSGLGVHYLLAATISFVAGGVLLYLLSIRFVFRFRRIKDERVELPAFVALGLVGLAIQTLVMMAAVRNLHAHYLLAKLGAASCTFLVNFALRRSLLFSMRGASSPPGQRSADHVTPTQHEYRT